MHERIRGQRKGVYMSALGKSSVSPPIHPPTHLSTFPLSHIFIHPPIHPCPRPRTFPSICSALPPFTESPLLKHLVIISLLPKRNTSKCHL